MTLSYMGNLKSLNGSQNSIYVHMNANKEQNQTTGNTDSTRGGWYNQTENYQIDLYEQSQENQVQQNYDQSYVANYYQAMSNASMMSTPATPVQQVNSPSCHFNNTVINTPLSVASQSSISYPGSNNANNILPHTPINNQASFHLQPPSVNIHAQLPQPQPTHFQQELSMLEVSPKRPNLKQPTVSRIKPFRLKPIDSIPVLNKNLFARSNLGLKNFLNSLCLSLNLSDSLQNSYRDINFDSCTLCVCNNKYLKGLDYSIYICYDLLNSTVDYYDEEATAGAGQGISGAGNMLAGYYMMNNTSRVDTGNGTQNGELTTHHQTCTCEFSASVSRKILADNAIATTYTKFKQSSNLAPYIKLADIVRSAGLGEISATTFYDQLIVLDSNCCNGLFLEDYLEELNINTAHSLFRACLRLKANDNSLQNYLINSVLIREGYTWKRALKSIKSIREKPGEAQKQPKVK